MNKEKRLFRMGVKTILITLGMTVLSLANINAADYTGATLTVADLGQYTGEGTYTYKEMQNDKPSFTFQNKMIAWNGSQWQIYAGRQIYASNTADTDSVPANGWVIISGEGSAVTITGECVMNNIEDNTPSYAGAIVTVTDLGQYTGEGEYTYKEMLNDKPSFTFQNRIIAWAGTQWQIYSGQQIYASNTADTDSVPANGWVIITGTGSTVTITGSCVEDNEQTNTDPYAGAELTLNGNFNGKLQYYETQSGKPVFGNEDMDGNDIYLVYQNSSWLIKFNGVDSLKCISYDKEIPENQWRGNISNKAMDLTIDAVDKITVNMFSEYTVEAQNINKLGETTFTCTGTENGYPSYTASDNTDTLYLMCTGSSWEIRADNKDGELYHKSNFINDYKCPQNGWSSYNGATPMLSGSYTLYFYEGSTITISGSKNEEFDGKLTCTSCVYGSMIFEGIINEKNIVLERKTLKQVITIDGVEVALSEADDLQTENGTLAIAQNGWYTDGEYSEIIISGTLTLDMYTSYYVTLNSKEFYYTNVENGHLNFATSNEDSTITFSEDNKQWEVHFNNVLYYTNSKAESLVPENGWSTVSGDKKATFESTNGTIYSFLNDIITVSGDITGEFVFTEEFEFNAPIFSTTNATGVLAGKTAYIIYEDYNWIIAYEDADSLITAFTYEKKGENHDELLVPQNYWSKTNGNISLSGDATYFELTDTEINVSGTDSCDGIFTYGYEKFDLEINENDYVVRKISNDSTEYWSIALKYYKIYTELYYNSNISGDLVPQTDWVAATGTPATDLIISGEGTFNPELSEIKENISAKQKLDIYPTLAKHSITIDTKDSGALSIININGAEVMNLNISSGKNTIEISNLTEGMYIITLKSNTNTYVSKIMKQ